MTAVTGAATLTHAGGLHARPAVKLTRLAKQFAAGVSVAAAAAGPWVDAKSIVRVMAMKLPRGATMHVRASGDDAAAAVAAIVALVRRDFDEVCAANPDGDPGIGQDHAGPA